MWKQFKIVLGFFFFLILQGLEKPSKHGRLPGVLKDRPGFIFQRSRCWGWRETGGKAATAKSRPVEGPVLGPAGPWFTSSGLCQPLSCCSSAESDPTASAKAKRICVTGGLLWLCPQKLNVFRSSPAEKSSSSPPLFFQTLAPSPLFLPTPFATTAAWVEQMCWMVPLLWSICCHQGPFVSLGTHASKMENNETVDSLLSSSAAVDNNWRRAGKEQPKWVKGKLNNTTSRV